MIDRTDEFVFVGFGKRVLAALIDGAIGWAFMPITMPLMTWTITQRNIVPEALWSVVWTIVWLWLVVRFGLRPCLFARWPCWSRPVLCPDETAGR